LWNLTIGILYLIFASFNLSSEENNEKEVITIELEHYTGTSFGVVIRSLVNRKIHHFKFKNTKCMGHFYIDFEIIKIDTNSRHATKRPFCQIRSFPGVASQISAYGIWSSEINIKDYLSHRDQASLKGDYNIRVIFDSDIDIYPLEEKYQITKNKIYSKAIKVTIK